MYFTFARRRINGLPIRANTAEIIKDKVRTELRNGLKKERILSQEDAILIKKFIGKISSELK